MTESTSLQTDLVVTFHTGDDGMFRACIWNGVPTISGSEISAKLLDVYEANNAATLLSMVSPALQERFFVQPRPVHPAENIGSTTTDRRARPLGEVLGPDENVGSCVPSSTDKAKIVAACVAVTPNPEHGPEQYGEVVDHLIEEEGERLLEMSTSDARDAVLAFMNL